MSAPVYTPQAMNHGRVVEIQERRRCNTTTRHGNTTIRPRGTVKAAVIAAELAAWGW